MAGVAIKSYMLEVLLFGGSFSPWIDGDNIQRQRQSPGPRVIIHGAAEDICFWLIDLINQTKHLILAKIA